MNYKIFIIMIVGLLTIGFVSAVNTTAGYYKNKIIPCSSALLDEQNRCCTEKGYTEYMPAIKTCIYKINMSNVEKNYYEKKVNVTGLNNAILRVKNNETAQHLEDILAKIQEKQKIQIAKLDNITAEINKNGITMVHGKKEVKFLGLLKIKYAYYCQIHEDGTALREHRIFDLLMKQNGTDICGEKASMNATAS